MCGLVGVAGKLEYKDEAMMKRLLVFDYFRGPDSTGLAAIRNNGDVKMAKAAVNPLDLFDMQKFKDANSGHPSIAFIGHNRLATKGGVNNVNAHPFQFGHIVGAHNGTLDHSSWKALEEAIEEKHEVDSMAVIHAIAKLGIEETVKLLQGAWALTWYDLEAKTINFLRNKERPLWMAYTKKFDHLFWASEYTTIDSALRTASGAQSYDMYQEEGTGHQYWATMPDWWYRWDIEKLRTGTDEFPKPRVKELKGKEPAPASSYTCGASNFPNRNYNSTPTNHSGSGSTHSHGTGTGASNDKPKRDCINVEGTEDKPFGGYLSEDQFNVIARHGCSWCSASVEFTEPGVTVFESQGQVLCPSCSSADGTTRMYVPDFSKIAG
jgi:predicted glutamine amidotransferase